MSKVRRLQFSTQIAAPIERVWTLMFDPAGYKAWTNAFADGSYFEGSWEEGEKILFLTPDRDGMVAVIAENRHHEFVSIKHLGTVNKGKEDTESDEAKSWAPAFENYTFRRLPGGTELIVELDTAADYEAYMRDAWPKALQQLKALCEQSEEA